MKKLIGICVAIFVTLFALLSFSENALAVSSFPYAVGGTGTTTPNIGQLTYWTKSFLSGVATTTASCSGSASCSTFTIIGSTPVTITASSGSFPFSADTNFGAQVYSTSTPTLWFKSGLYASSTSIFTAASSTYASSSFSTVGSSAWFTSLATAAGTFLALDANGKLIATTTPASVNSNGFTQAVNYATTGALPANNYVAGVITEIGNGALSVDSAAPTVGQRILVKNEGTQANNGIYVVTATGSGIAVFVLTRSSDYNSNLDIFPGLTTYVISGTTNVDTFWALTSAAPITVGSTNLTYVEAAGGGANVSGSGTQGQLSYWTGTNALGTIATSAPTFNGGLTTSGTAGSWVGGSSYVVSISAPVSIANGGTNATTLTTSGNVLYYDGTREATALTTAAATLPYATTTSISSVNGAYFGTTAGGILSVGSTTPWGLLSVNANGFTTGAPQFTVGSSTYTSFLVASNRNVGIGTSTPWAAFTLDRNNLGVASSSIVVTEYPPATTTGTIDCRDSNRIRWRNGAGSKTLTLAQGVPGESCTVVLQEPNEVGGAITWAAATGQQIYYAGAAAPTQTTTANAMDTYGILFTQGSSTIIALISAGTNYHN